MGKKKKNKKNRKKMISIEKEHDVSIGSALTAENEDTINRQYIDDDDEDKEDDQNGDEEEERMGMMGWTAKKYLLALKTPDHPQLLMVTLDSMFVSAVMRSKETKRAIKLSGYPSKIVGSDQFTADCASVSGYAFDSKSA